MNHDAKCLVMIFTSHFGPSPTTNTFPLLTFKSRASLLLASGLLSGFGNLAAALLGLGHALDNADSYGLECHS